MLLQTRVQKVTSGKDVRPRTSTTDVQKQRCNSNVLGLQHRQWQKPR